MDKDLGHGSRTVDQVSSKKKNTQKRSLWFACKKMIKIESLVEGTHVFAKQNGYAPWPATISSINKSRTSAVVKYFGFEDYKGTVKFNELVQVDDDSINTIRNLVLFTLQTKSIKEFDRFEEAVNDPTLNIMPKISDGSPMCIFHMEIDEIIKTFNDNKEMLKSIFKERCGRLDKFNDGYGYDYITVLFRTVKPDQQRAMYTRIFEEFIPDANVYAGNVCSTDLGFISSYLVGFNYLMDNNNNNKINFQKITLQHELLFWCILLPEWVIGICEKAFNSRKEDILKQIMEEDKRTTQREIEENDSFDYS